MLQKFFFFFLVYHFIILVDETAVQTLTSYSSFKFYIWPEKFLWRNKQSCKWTLFFSFGFRLCIWWPQVWWKCSINHQKQVDPPHIVFMGLWGQKHGLPETSCKSSWISTGMLMTSPIIYIFPFFWYILSRVSICYFINLNIRHDLSNHWKKKKNPSRHNQWWVKRTGKTYVVWQI